MNHRIAILSDIHGDTRALEAVIADARALGATEFWLLGDILLPGPGREDLFELLDAIPITAAVRGNWDDCVLEALDGEYGLEDPQEIQLLRLTQYLMEGLDPKRIDWLRSLPLVEKKEVNGIRFSLTHNLPEKNYGGDLRPANATENFDQLLDDQTDMAIYGHVHKQLLMKHFKSLTKIKEATVDEIVTVGIPRTVAEAVQAKLHQGKQEEASPLVEVAEDSEPYQS